MIISPVFGIQIRSGLVNADIISVPKHMVQIRKIRAPRYSSMRRVKYNRQ